MAQLQARNSHNDSDSFKRILKSFRVSRVIVYLTYEASKWFIESSKNDLSCKNKTSFKATLSFIKKKLMEFIKIGSF